MNHFSSLSFGWCLGVDQYQLKIFWGDIFVQMMENFLMGESGFFLPAQYQGDWLLTQEVSMDSNPNTVPEA